MFKNLMDFFSGTKMTIVSAVFLLISLYFMLGDVNSNINPAWGTIIISGLPIAFNAIKGLIFCRCISSSLLITVAMAASIIIGELFAAGEVAVIMAIGELLEDATIDKAKRGLGRLLELTPPTVHKILADGQEETVEIKKVEKGDTLRVLAGETIPVDGVIIQGETSVNQANLTGESFPVEKTIGDKVMAGTLNQFGVIEIKTETVKNTYLQKMIKLVKEAENKKAPTQKIIDMWAAVLVPNAMVIAFLTYFLTHEIIRAVTVLVVFCPCALVLATPTSIMAAIGQAAKRGVLIKSGAALEEMGKVDTFVFDKTGTLTTGKIEVSDLIPNENEISADNLLQIAASMEQYSEHSLAKAITSLAEIKEISLSVAQKVEIFPGKGVVGELSGNKIIVGNLKFMKEYKIPVISAVQKQIQKLCQQGKALIMVARANKIIGIIALTDTIRPEAQEMVALLNTPDDAVVMLTGDNKTAAARLAQIIGVKKYYADLLPNNKVEQIEKLQQNGHIVCMTGDGVNDAPALKTANVSIAMGKIGSDIAIDAADIALINDNIQSIPYLKKLASITLQTIKFNIMLSMTLNFIGILLSISGVLTPVTGAIVHNLGSVLVVLNAARLYDKNL